jgi:hypothetical protein
MVIEDLDGHRTPPLRRGPPPYRRLFIELAEARDVLGRLVQPTDDDAHNVVAALIARDLVPPRCDSDWEALVPRLGWLLGRFGVPMLRSAEIVIAVVEADDP